MSFDDATRRQLGQRLKFECQRRNLDLAELSERTGLSQAVVSKVWRGVLKRPHHYELLAQALGQTLDAMLAIEQEVAAPATTGASAQVIALPTVEQTIEATRAPVTGRCQAITIAARKGGTTKTTTAVHLAGGLARRGYSVLLVDLDGQCDATEWLAPEEVDLSEQKTSDDVIRYERTAAECIIPSTIEGLDLIPAGPQLDELQSALVGQWGAERRLKHLIAPLRTRYDFILFDCPADVDLRAVSALMASQWVLIPTTASTLDLKGLFNFVPKVLKYADPELFNAQLQFLGVVVGRVKKNTVMTRESLQWLDEEFGSLLFEHVIHESTRYQELASHQALIYETSPDLAADYEGLISELLDRLALAHHVGARAGKEG